MTRTQAIAGGPAPPRTHGHTRQFDAVTPYDRRPVGARTRFPGQGQPHQCASRRESHVRTEPSPDLPG